MRRKEKEVAGYPEIMEIMKKCRVARLALNDGEYPYIVPMNFGVEYRDEEINLYFHCAAMGKRYELICANNKVGFEMDIAYRLIAGEKACKYDMQYESVVGKGLIEIVPDDEKRMALDILMSHYTEDTLQFDYNEEVLKKTTVFRLKVIEVTGKRNVMG